MSWKPAIPGVTTIGGLDRKGGGATPLAITGDADHLQIDGTLGAVTIDETALQACQGFDFSNGAESVILNATGGSGETCRIKHVDGTLSIAGGELLVLSIEDVMTGTDLNIPGAGGGAPATVASLTLAGVVVYDTIAFAGRPPSTLNLLGLTDDTITTITAGAGFAASTTLTWDLSGQTVASTIFTWLASEASNLVAGTLNLGLTLYPNKQATSGSILVAGTGYSVNDVVSVENMNGTPATLRVDSVDEFGGITATTLLTGGDDYLLSGAYPIMSGNADAVYNISALGNLSIEQFSAATGISVTFNHT